MQNTFDREISNNVIRIRRHNGVVCVCVYLMIYFGSSMEKKKTKIIVTKAVVDVGTKTDPAV